MTDGGFNAVVIYREPLSRWELLVCLYYSRLCYRLVWREDWWLRQGARIDRSRQLRDKYSFSPRPPILLRSLGSVHSPFLFVSPPPLLGQMVPGLRRTGAFEGQDPKIDEKTWRSIWVKQLLEADAFKIQELPTDPSVVRKFQWGCITKSSRSLPWTIPQDRHHRSSQNTLKASVNLTGNKVCSIDFHILIFLFFFIVHCG